MAWRAKISRSRAGCAVVLRALVVCALSFVVTVPAVAQWRSFFGETHHYRPQQRGPGYFPFFRDFGTPPGHRRPAPRADYSHAPKLSSEARKKSDKDVVSTIVVLGDSMADWLGYGLEEVLSDRPEIGVVRKVRTNSGLVRYDAKDESEDWAKAARQMLAGEKANAVVMIIGMHDRIAIREHEQPPSEQKPKDNSGQPSVAKPEQPSIAKPEHPRGRLHTYEFKSEKWVAAYTKRIDDTIAALKSRAVPVFWVGLPPIRGRHSTADMAFLNDLFKARAAKAGITYVDVWDAFTNEQGRYVVYGPDFEGQRRRLRAGDGVHFTKAGALKLAHYVEHEIRRVMGNRLVPVNLPTQELQVPQGPVEPGKPAPRPLVGPVLPLTAVPAGGNELLGAAGVRAPRSDPIATRVLVKGEAPPKAAGRADDFAWPRKEANVAAQPQAGKTATKPAKASSSEPTAKSPAPAKKSTAAIAPTPADVAPTHAHAKKTGPNIARRRSATVAGQPVLRPPAPIPLH
jgi:uncharacterized protein